MDYLRTINWFGKNNSLRRYTNADFGDDDSINSVQLNEGLSSNALHVRYQPGGKLWEIRSHMEKILLFLCLFLFTIVLILSVVVNVVENHLQVAKENEINYRANAPCLNKTCINIASRILDSMDFSVDPCNDFYSYSCNNWLKVNPPAEGKSNWDSFSKLEHENYLIIKRVLDLPIDSFKSKAEKKAKMYYQSCLDSNETVEKLGAQPLLDVIGKLGGWSVGTKGFNISGWNLQTTIQNVQTKYTVGALFSFGVGEDDRNSTRHTLEIDQSGLGLPTRDHYLNKTANKEILDAYLEAMIKIGVLLGGERNDTTKKMTKVLEFETRLANITIPIDQRRDEESNYHLITLADLQERANFIDWRKFFENAMRIVQKKITSKEQIVVYAPDYLGNLTSLLQEYQNSSDGNNTINNYLMWQTIKLYPNYLSKPFRDALRGLKKVLTGPSGGEEAQWRYCMEDTNNVLGFALGAIFVREIFNPQSKQQAEIMINNVRNAFIKNFENLQWMDEQTRRLAIEKANAITDMIGYPEFIKDINHLDERFENLTIRSDTYFENFVNINIYSMKLNLKKINEAVNKTTWSMVPSTVNAYYTPIFNQMVFPAGILQSPFYDPSFPDSLNYGAMGVIMGHELTHGFDDQGRQYDKYGNLNHWWNNKTVEKFNKQTKCFVEQYDQYKIYGNNLKGNKTLGENIADNGGVKAAFHAYLEIMKKKAEPKTLPGLSLNHKQLFFVAFAQVWCSNTTKEATKLELQKDSHSPALFRVMGALSNLKEFSEEFHCKIGSNMNPVKKCEVW